MSLMTAGIVNDIPNVTQIDPMVIVVTVGKVLKVTPTITNPIPMTQVVRKPSVRNSRFTESNETMIPSKLAQRIKKD
ncbi:MAG: hypothetical protein LRY71_07885 [Bacillaceae bacterium]|nr:hypothetical protein [Bacillaceae bacterium]